MSDTNPHRAGRSSGWFKAARGNDALELIRANPLAYVLAAVIAHRARWREGFSGDDLHVGEAYLGDYQSYGLTEQNYRTAKAQLAKWGFATFKPTNKGTVAKLTDTRLFDVLPFVGNGQTNGQPTDSQRTGNGQVTTNEDHNQVNPGNQKRGYAPPPSKTEWEALCKKAEPGLPAWKIEEAFLKQEAKGWRGIVKPAAHAELVASYWRTDGSPLSPPTRNGLKLSPYEASLGQPPVDHDQPF